MARKPVRKTVSAPTGLRTVGVRVGVAAALAAAAAGVYVFHQSGAPKAVAQRPVAVAAAPSPPVVTPVAAAPEPAPEPPRHEAAPDAAKPMPASLRASFDAWLMGAYAKCWKAPKTLPDGDPYLPKVRVAFKEDGALAGPPRLVNPPADAAWKPHAEAALKAVKGCDPLHVPDKYAEYYPSWKSRTVYFDPARN